MNDGEIQQRTEELDAALTKDGAELIIYCEDLEEGTCELIGNRSGYLRAGVEMLRAAIAPLDSHDSITPIDVNYLVHDKRSLRVSRFTRQEDVQAALPRLEKHTWRNRVMGVGCLTIVVFLAICTLIGIVEVGNLVFGK